MYLTHDEFLVLSARKMGVYLRKDIGEKFKISETKIAHCDNNLFKKYGIKAKSSVEAKQKLVEVVDLKKVKVVDMDKMPYFEYEPVSGHPDIFALVKKMKITKKDIEVLSEYFKNVEDKNKEYELILDEDFNNMYRFLRIKNPETGEKTEIKSEID